MKELVIVRHGEADHMVRSLTGGWSNSHLTERGKQQACLAGEDLQEFIGERPFHFYASDLARAAETAEIIGEFIAQQPELTIGLREQNNGQAANLTRQEAAMIAIPITEPILDWAPYPGAESWRTMSCRVVAFLESIEPEYDLTLLVLHEGCANAVICWWLGIGIGEKNIAFQLDSCSISHFEINRWGERVIVRLNDTRHLSSLSQESVWAG